MNDGEVVVTAVLGGLVASCIVVVEADYHFSIRFRTLNMYPGEKPDGSPRGTGRDVPFEVKPVTNNVNWFVTGESDVVTLEPNYPMMNNLRVYALKEGRVTVQGTAMGSPPQIMTINVAWRFSFNTKSGFNIKPLYYDDDKPHVEQYTIYPPISELKATVKNGTGSLIPASDFRIVISDPDPVTGQGNITYYAYKELGQVIITFQQFMGNDDTDIKSTTEVRLLSQYDPEDQRITPFFLRYDGFYSNTNLNKTQYRDGNLFPGAENIKGSGQNYEFNLGDGESHFILFDRKYSNFGLLRRILFCKAKPF